MHTYKKIHRFMHVIEYFSMRQWDYQMDNLNGLWAGLSKRDKELFFFDMGQLDWDMFLQHYFRGIRQYLLKDPLETIPEALVRWNRQVSLNINRLQFHDFYFHTKCKQIILASSDAEGSSMHVDHTAGLVDGVAVHLNVTENHFLHK